MVHCKVGCYFKFQIHRSAKMDCGRFVGTSITKSSTRSTIRKTHSMCAYPVSTISTNIPRIMINDKSIEENTTSQKNILPHSDRPTFVQIRSLKRSLSENNNRETLDQFANRMATRAKRVSLLSRIKLGHIVV